MKKATSFSTRLNEVMRERGMTQSDLLKICSLYHDKKGHTISQASLSQYLSGERKPRPARLQILATALSVDPGYLLGYDAEQGRDRNAPDDPDSSLHPEDLYTRAIAWLRESGWRIKKDDSTGNYTVRKRGWNHDRAVILPEQQMHLYLDLYIGFWEYLMRHPVSMAAEAMFEELLSK